MKILKKIIDEHWHLHFLACAVIVFLLSFLSVIGAVIVTLLIGVAKEVNDKFCGGDFDWTDIIADCLGIITGVWIFHIT